MNRLVLACSLLAFTVPIAAQQDRITIGVTSRVASGTELTVTLASGATLTVKASDLVYVRDEWPHWIDEDGDCQDTRQEVLIAESISPVTLDAAGCRVIGGAWRDMYTGSTITDPGELDVDHLVPLANAFRTGGWAWNRIRRQQYANDLNDASHLVAVSASANRQKGDKGPEEWRPSDTSAWCAYGKAWTDVKQRWGLAATSAEQAGLQQMLVGCSTSTTTPTPTPPAATCVNINSASSADLQRIIHIGPDRAAEIIRLRPFRSVDDLTRVSGIGAARLADIKAQGLACV